MFYNWQIKPGLHSTYVMKKACYFMVNVAHQTYIPNDGASSLLWGLDFVTEPLGRYKSLLAAARTYLGMHILDAKTLFSSHPIYTPSAARGDMLMLSHSLEWHCGGVSI